MTRQVLKSTANKSHLKKLEKKAKLEDEISRSRDKIKKQIEELKDKQFEISNQRHTLFNKLAYFLKRANKNHLKELTIFYQEKKGVKRTLRIIHNKEGEIDYIGSEDEKNGFLRKADLFILLELMLNKEIRNKLMGAYKRGKKGTKEIDEINNFFNNRENKETIKEILDEAEGHFFLLPKEETYFSLTEENKPIYKKVKAIRIVNYEFPVISFFSKIPTKGDLLNSTTDEEIIYFDKITHNREGVYALEKPIIEAIKLDIKDIKKNIKKIKKLQDELKKYIGEEYLIDTI